MYRLRGVSRILRLFRRVYLQVPATPDSSTQVSPTVKAFVLVLFVDNGRIDHQVLKVHKLHDITR